ncbi:unnamed protein product [Eruca vesicaria subsp. sativa]|uniref:Uncharacterized protein n=1 Tax=Eruca vesicaria subsp. sativa TaxID=29727 RepID=A0ABC8J7B1_ERUVS|nr:unnamed protein product [Eruca vesicaria subsp. sativa]
MMKVIAYLLMSIITTFFVHSALFLSLVNAISSSDQTSNLRKTVIIRVVSYSLPLPIGSVLVLDDNGVM